MKEFTCFCFGLVQMTQFLKDLLYAVGEWECAFPAQCPGVPTKSNQAFKWTFGKLSIACFWNGYQKQGGRLTFRPHQKNSKIEWVENKDWICAHICHLEKTDQMTFWELHEPLQLVIAFTTFLSIEFVCIKIFYSLGLVNEKGYPAAHSFIHLFPCVLHHPFWPCNPPVSYTDDWLISLEGFIWML